MELGIVKNDLFKIIFFRKSDPVNINPDKRWQFKSSHYQNKGYNAENYSYKKNEYSKGSPYRSSSSHLPHSTTSPLSKFIQLQVVMGLLK